MKGFFKELIQSALNRELPAVFFLGVFVAAVWIGSDGLMNIMRAFTFEAPEVRHIYMALGMAELILMATLCSFYCVVNGLLDKIHELGALLDLATTSKLERSPIFSNWDSGVLQTDPSVAARSVAMPSELI